MSTTPTAPPPARTWWRGWADFWFRPADPTTIGFVRIVTGLLVLYVYLAYSFDLQAFFGKHGWYALSYVDRERRELPWHVTPFLEWDTAYPARLSEYPHRQKALLGFLRDIPGNKNERNYKLAYLYRADKMAPPDDPRRADDFIRAMVYVQQMQTRAGMDAHLAVLRGNGVQDKTARDAFQDAAPEVFRSLDAAERARVADEIVAFWSVLPADDTARTYVFNHLVELPPNARRVLVNYIADLPEDAAERGRLLDYLGYWNDDPRTAYRTGSNAFSPWFHVTDPTQMAVIHGFVLVLIVLFTIGLFTRVTSVLVWLACVGYIHRTAQVLFGMDTMMNILLFYLMIGNSGAALSADRLIARYRAVRASLRRTGTIDANTRAFLACPPPSVGAGFAMRLLQIHVCFIYTAAGLSKLKGSMWWTGQAFWDVVVNPEFTMLSYKWYEEGLRWMASSKPVYHAMCTLSVWFTLFVEIALPFLVWTRARWWILLFATAMHAGIGVLMGLNLFELMMMVMFLSFMPDRVIRDRFRGGPDLPKFAFTFDPAVPTHTRAAALALALDVDNQIALTAEKGAGHTAVSADGKSLDGAEGTRVLSKGLRFVSVVSILLWVPGVRALLTRLLFPGKASSPPAASVGSVKPPSPTAAR